MSLEIAYRTLKPGKWMSAAQIRRQGFQDIGIAAVNRALRNLVRRGEAHMMERRIKPGGRPTRLYQKISEDS